MAQILKKSNSLQRKDPIIRKRKRLNRFHSERTDTLKNSVALKVHPMFFKEFATKTWTSINRVVAELVENSFDEDATKVIITILDDGSIYLEDDAGMDEESVDKFLLVGSPHKQEEQISPRFKRFRSGRYGTGKLGFLTAFRRMILKTRKNQFSAAFELDENVLEALVSGEVDLRIIEEKPLRRKGTEIRLLEPKVKVDPYRLVNDLKRLECLKQPFFELYIKNASKFSEWRINGASMIEPPWIEGFRVPVSETGLEGEIIISKRPLPEEERGLAIMIGGHAVARNDFDISGIYADRISGWVRGEGLTARFADKSALVEDDAFEEFSKKIKNFLKENIIPLMRGYVEVEITREETRVYRQVDRILADAVNHVIESIEDEEIGYEMESKKAIGDSFKDEYKMLSASSNFKIDPREEAGLYDKETSIQNTSISQPFNNESTAGIEKRHGKEGVKDLKNFEDSREKPGTSQLNFETANPSFTQLKSSGVIHLKTPSGSQINLSPSERTIFKTTKTRKVRRTFTLDRVGYRVIPYEDDEDEKEAFDEDNVIYVNKAHPAYRAEVQKGGELLLRHVVRLVTKIMALSRHPEGKEALELQNKLIAEAIKIRQQKTHGKDK